MPSPSAWIKIAQARPGARSRLFCLPFGGAGAGIFRDWPRQLPADVEVRAVQLPGREERLMEPPIDRVEVVVDHLVEAVEGSLDRPFALFGHSMGAFIAYELVGRLRSAGREPTRLFISACRAPSRRLRTPPRHALSAPDFIRAIRGLSDAPADILEHVDFRDVILPMIRSDFKIAETFTPRPQPRLRCPVVAFGGLDDEEVVREDLEAWSAYVEGPFEVRMLAGDHFFMRPDQSGRELLRLIGNELAGEPAR